MEKDDNFLEAVMLHAKAIKIDGNEIFMKMILILLDWYIN